MSSVIKPKRSNTSSAIPTTSDLADGELAVNTADGKIYLRVGSDIIVVANTAEGGSSITDTDDLSEGSINLYYTNARVDAEIDSYLTAGSGINISSGTISISSSPALTGTPTAPTASTGTNTTQLATTAFVQQEIDALKALLYAYEQ